MKKEKTKFLTNDFYFASYLLWKEYEFLGIENNDPKGKKDFVFLIAKEDQIKEYNDFFLNVNNPIKKYVDKIYLLKGLLKLKNNNNF